MTAPTETPIPDTLIREDLAAAPDSRGRPRGLSAAGMAAAVQDVADEAAAVHSHRVDDASPETAAPRPRPYSPIAPGVTPCGCGAVWNHEKTPRCDGAPATPRDATAGPVALGMADPLEPREPESREPSTIADAFAAMLACLAALLGEREAWTSAMIRALRDLVTRAAEEHARERPDIDAEDLWTDYRTERGTVTSDERRAFLAGVEAGRRTTRPSDEPRRTRIGGRHIWIADYKRQADDAPPPLRVLYNCKDEPDETREHAASAIVLQDIARSVDHLTGPRGSHLPPPRLTLPGLTAVMTLEALGGAATRCELHEAGKRPRRVRSARLVVDGLEVFAETSRDVEGAPVAAALDPSPRTEARERLGRIVREEWIARSVREQTAVQDAVELHRYEQALDKVAAAVREAWAHRGETAPAPSKPVDRERGRPYAPEIERAILPHVVAALRRMRAVASDPHDSARFALKTIEDAVDNARKMLDAGRLDGAIDILADVEPEADDDSAADPKAGQS